MTTINNNLTIEQMREIVESAPDGATHIIESFKSLDYLKFDGSWWILYEYTNAPSEWVLTCFRTILAEFKESIQRLDDLRTAIAKHDATDIGAEIDTFLDAFKSPELTDERKEELTQDWKGMSGGVAFSLIERHADNWKEIDYMMNQWLEANKEAEGHG